MDTKLKSFLLRDIKLLPVSQELRMQNAQVIAEIFSPQIWNPIFMPITPSVKKIYGS